MSNNYIVTIGRQLGSGGREIGEKLAARLGIGFYDKELLSLASKESGLCREFFEKADEKPSNRLLGSIYGMRFPYISDGAIPCENCLSHDALFKCQSDVMRHLADQHSCLFVGRCADYVLREYPRCLNLFISAPLDFRIDRLCRLNRVERDAAESLVVKSDKKRAEYYNGYAYKAWGVASTYHLCIDSSVLGVEETVTLLENFIVRKFRLK